METKRNRIYSDHQVREVVEYYRHHKEQLSAVAVRFGIPEGTIQQWLNGKRRANALTNKGVDDRGKLKNTITNSVYTEEFIDKVRKAYHARQTHIELCQGDVGRYEGTVDIAAEFGIPSSTINNWVRKYEWHKNNGQDAPDIPKPITTRSKVMDYLEEKELDKTGIPELLKDLSNAKGRYEEVRAACDILRKQIPAYPVFNCTWVFDEKIILGETLAQGMKEEARRYIGQLEEIEVTEKALEGCIDFGREVRSTIQLLETKVELAKQAVTIKQLEKEAIVVAEAANACEGFLTKLSSTFGKMMELFKGE